MPEDNTAVDAETQDLTPEERACVEAMRACARADERLCVANGKLIDALAPDDAALGRSHLRCRQVAAALGPAGPS